MKKKLIPFIGSLAFALVMLIGIAALTTPAEAKGRRGGGTTSPPPTGTCSVSPNPVAANADFTLSGGGYGSGEYLTVAITSGGGVSYRWTQANSSGSFSLVARVFTAGSNSVKVYDSVSGAQVGGCSFSSY
jgi:hypothetical protein